MILLLKGHITIVKELTTQKVKADKLRKTIIYQQQNELNLPGTVLL